MVKSILRTATLNALWLALLVEVAFAQQHPNAIETSFTFDATNRRTSVVDAKGARTTFSYDAASRTIKVTDVMGAPTLLRYDAEGNLIEKVDRAGRRIRFLYSAENERIKEEWLNTSGATIQTFLNEYDAVGNLLFESDGVLGYRFNYDALSRPISISTESSQFPLLRLSFGYDAADRRTSVSDHSGVSVHSSYDSVGNLIERRWLGGMFGPVKFAFGYDRKNNRTLIERRSSDGFLRLLSTTHYEFDNVDRISKIDHNVSGTSLVYSYDYRADDLVSKVARANLLREFQYDFQGQLVEASSAILGTENFAYDDSGNRVGTEYVTDSANRVLTDPLFDYAYDAEGNRVEKKHRESGEVTRYSYDYRNRLVGVKIFDSSFTQKSEITFTYDCEDRRVSKIVNGSQTYTLYDGSHAWQDFDQSKQPKTRYLYGVHIDEILARANGDEVGYYLTDGYRTVGDIHDVEGTLIDSIHYRVFGAILSETHPESGDRFKFTAREYDVETGLYYYRGRYYDPILGRFISEDPLSFAAGDANLYRYVYNAPTSGLDPFGHNDITEANSLIRNVAQRVGPVVRCLGGVIAQNALEQGLYLFVAQSGLLYVGQSSDVGRRLGQHGGRILNEVAETIRIALPETVASSRYGRERAEQAVIDWLRANFGQIENARNSYIHNPLKETRKYPKFNCS